MAHNVPAPIGMPLVAGLDMRQFAGVLAHEFGHFSQGVGMRLTYIIRSISHWFTRVVYERDSWDEWLARSTDNLDLRIAWVFNNLGGNENNQSFTGVIIERAGALRESLNHVHEVVGNTPYPFDHAEGQVSLSQYMIPHVPAEGDLGALYETAEQLLERMPELYARIASRLAVFAERVEEVLGLAPLEATPKANEP